MGGIGTVYLAERSDGTFEQRVAVKLLNPAVMTEEGIPYLILEYVEGIRIDEYCSNQNLSTREICHLFVAVCEAVHFTHAHLVVHRDLKPTSILVRRVSGKLAVTPSDSMLDFMWSNHFHIVTKSGVAGRYRYSG